jgi:hypothetical protein
MSPSLRSNVAEIDASNITPTQVRQLLASSQAAALRTNNVLSTINTTVRTDAAAFANDFVTNLEKGESVLHALGDAAAGVGKTLQTAGINSLVTTGLNALAPSVSSTAGATASATILTTAGTTLAAAMVTGATSAGHLGGRWNNGRCSTDGGRHRCGSRRRCWHVSWWC